MSGIDVEDEDGQIIIIEDFIRYDRIDDNTLIDEVNIQGRVIEDTCVFNSRNHTTIIDPLEFLGITGTGGMFAPSTVLQMPGTGYIGLAPHTEVNRDYNFLYNLKKTGQI